jgi:hypothetical protein
MCGGGDHDIATTSAAPSLSDACPPLPPGRRRLNASDVVLISVVYVGRVTQAAGRLARWWRTGARPAGWRDGGGPGRGLTGNRVADRVEAGRGEACRGEAGRVARLRLAEARPAGARPAGARPDR